jgi:hypothetical protein
MTANEAAATIHNRQATPKLRENKSFVLTKNVAAYAV